MGVKTNVLYDATSTINLGVEVGLAPKWTLDVSGNYNPWTFSDYKKLKHWMLQPEGRYWLCERFNGHFFGLHALGGEFNLSNLDLPFGTFSALENSRAQGWFAGGGVGYGYHWIWATTGAWRPNSASVSSTRTTSATSASIAASCWAAAHKNYLGVTKAAISIIYIIK